MAGRLTRGLFTFAGGNGDWLMHGVPVSAPCWSDKCGQGLRQLSLTASRSRGIGEEPVPICLASRIVRGKNAYLAEFFSLIDLTTCSKSVAAMGP